MGAGPDLVRGAMSRLETGANASSWVAASRRDEALLWAPNTRPAEELSQGAGRGQRTCAGGGRRGPFGPQQPEGAGIREPPLSFKLKNDCVGAVIGKSFAGLGKVRGGGGSVALSPRPPRLQSPARERACPLPRPTQRLLTSFALMHHLIVYQFSQSVQSFSRVRLFRPYGLQQARPPCPLPASRVHPKPCPSSR